MSQNWFRPHPYGVYPRGNAQGVEDLMLPRFGTLSHIQCAAKGRASRGRIAASEPSEDAFVELLLHLLSFCSVKDLCRLSATCTGWYCFIHASDAFKQAHDIVSHHHLRFCGSWKETAVRSCLLQQKEDTAASPTKRYRKEHSTTSNTAAVAAEDDHDDNNNNMVLKHRPIAVRRAFFNDLLFQAWMCTILPCHYHLRSDAGTKDGAAWLGGADGVPQAPRYRSALKEVPRCSGLSPAEFRERFEEPNLPVVLTDVATSWPIFDLLQGKFENLAAKRAELFRPGISPDVPLRCEHTTMNVAEYVRYAVEQTDERPIYLFDAEFGASMAVESLYTVPAHFGGDDFFKVLGDSRPKYRWIIAGPRRGGSSFHVDPNYTNAWNANLTGRKRWILFPPGCTPAGVFPSEDMSEVTTPVSLTEWLLNHYDASVEQWRDVGYECICEAGDIMFVPCGWWHFVINLEDSVAITQNYVSECNLPSVIKFLSAMKSSISGIDEDADNATGEMVEKRRANFVGEFVAAMRTSYSDVMQRVESALAEEEQQRQKRRECNALPLLDAGAEGFTFNF
ncbi:transferase, transferring glycosyl group [Trypanosoma grayi]|uniref:transferase, transferring glycosyl group n=1 Tax=Trypanosoma grayi TaxID=71804 RepID=UPI0004F48803|nr:transferase, transferring glycosyl group [Trypanosoma grayi]KEG10542.1 transferase, transferring glycosyl group [Trypanosoma grayi]